MDLSRGAKTGATKWNKARTAYKCADGTRIQVQSMVVVSEQSDSDDTDCWVECVNGVEYGVYPRDEYLRLLVSGTEFNRDMSRIVKGADDVKTITFPSTVREARDDVFWETEIRSAILNEGLETLGQYQSNVWGEVMMLCHGVFDSTELRKVKLPLTLQRLEDYVFSRCRSLREVTFGEKSALTYIGKYAFYCCDSLRSITFPEGLETINKNAFDSSGLEEITLPGTLKEADYDAFKGCANLKTVYVGDGCEASLLDLGFPDSARVVPLQNMLVEGVNVLDLRNLKQIVIPEGVEKIGNHWFWTTGVESVTVPASVREIGAAAFCYCKQLKHVTFAEGSMLEKLGAHCFSNTGLEKIVIPRAVKEFQKAAFANSKSLAEVVFEENSSLKRVEESAFYGCNNLRGISFPEGLEYIGYGCFGYSGLERIAIPSSVTELGDSAFRFCKDLKKVAFQESSRLQKIGSLCFHDSGLEEFVAPPGLREICDRAFLDCERLRRVVLNEGLADESVCEVCDRNGIEEIVLPSTLKKIEKGTFAGCNSLRTVYVKRGCTADFSELKLPSSVKAVWV